MEKQLVHLNRMFETLTLAKLENVIDPLKVLTMNIRFCLSIFIGVVVVLKVFSTLHSDPKSIKVTKVSKLQKHQI